MAPHSLDTILVQPAWPSSLSDFVTWCLMWDPKNRPTCAQALAHEYFRDAVDPLRRPKSSSKLLLSRKHSTATVGPHESNKENSESMPLLGTKTSSWFRRSLIQREASAPVLPQHAPQIQPAATSTPLQPVATDSSNTLKPRANANKRATWTNGLSTNAAPMPILPSIRPVSPMSDAVTAQASVRKPQMHDSASNKVGRQLSQSNGHQSRDAERALTGQSGLASPTSSQREGFFSHLRKRARRFSGRYQTPISPNDDIESSAASSNWTNARHSQLMNSLPPIPGELGTNGVRTSLDGGQGNHSSAPIHRQATQGGVSLLKRHHSTGSKDPSSSHPRNRKATHKQSHPNLQYETPDEEDEILNEAIMVARYAGRHSEEMRLKEAIAAAQRVANDPEEMLLQEAIVAARYASRHPDYSPIPVQNLLTPERSKTTQAGNGYLMTPSPSANRNSIHYGQMDYQTQSKPEAQHGKRPAAPPQSKWPTPPYDSESPKGDWNTTDWAQSTMNTIFASAKMYS
jgi:meiosis induction protein kinase IME2/SME1